MKKYIFLQMLAIIGFQAIINAQNHTTTLSTGNSGTGSNIDVVYHRIYWRISPDSSVKYIKGNVFTKFKTIQNNVASISFDLNDSLKIDSIKYHKSLINTVFISRLNDIVTITLPSTLANSLVDSIQIFYQGFPPNNSGALGGFYKVQDQTSNQNYICTLSESYEDRDWWPCKADMQDKVDSFDISVNVPWTGKDTFWVASNGKLMDSSILGGNRTFHFHSNYPIASYLICISVARYNRYYRGTVTVGTDKVPVIYNIIRGKTSTQNNAIFTAMDKIKNVVTAFSNKFGNYPFSKDKYGFYEGLVNADGMEHQSFSGIATMGLTRLTTLSHELCHQWFGDAVTCATWNDLWLNEGFASYGEILAAELVPSLGQSVLAKMQNYKNNAQSLSTTSVYIPNTDIINSNTIWMSNYGSTVYQRGCMVNSMLRAMCGDSIFFKALQNYQTHNAYNSVTTDSLKNEFNRLLNVDITPFFTDYVYGTGNPTYNLKCDILGNNLNVSIINQTQSSGSTVSYFRGPVVLRIQGSSASQDTLITFVDWGNNNLSYAGKNISATTNSWLNYKLSFTPTTITVDPYFQTLIDGSITLNLRIIDFTVQQNKHNNKAILLLDDNTNNSEVILQKSIDGIEFSNIGIMKSNDNKTYNFVDEKLTNNINFYRAKLVDEKGNNIYSKIIAINNKINKTFEIVSNKNSFIKIKSLNNNNQNYTLTLTNTLGETLANKAFQGNDVLSFNVSNFAQGIYFISLYNENNLVETQKIILYGTNN